MARPRKFDEDQLVAQARRAFWKHGYHGTSAGDIVEATLEPGSG
jgi:TetR/AcrR family transcriptional regulator, transcriptional repressor for nem operon